MHQFLVFIFGIKLYMFRAVPLSIMSFYTVQTAMVYVIQFCWQLASRISKPVWHIPLLFVQWKTHDGQRNCPKHVEFYSKNKFEKLMHQVGFIIGMICYSHSRVSSCLFIRPDPARKLSANLYDIQLLFVQWKTHDGQRKCPKHVEFYSKNELEKLVHLVGFIIRKRLKSERLSGCRVRYMMLSSVLRVSKCTWLVYFGFVQFFPCFYFDFCQGRIPVNIGWPTSNGTSSTFWETMDWGIKG